MEFHRSKCSKLISKVVSSALFEDLKKDMKGKKFSVDKSNDLGIKKHLCVIIRYYSESRLELVTECGGLVSVVVTTDKDFFLALTEILEKQGISLTDCVVFGCDGASSMIGEHDSVWSRVRKLAS